MSTAFAALGGHNKRASSSWVQQSGDIQKAMQAAKAPPPDGPTADQLVQDARQGGMDKSAALTPFAAMGGGDMEKQAFIKNFVDGAWNATVKPFTKGIGNIAKGVGNVLGGGLKTVGNLVSTPFRATYGAIGQGVRNAMDGQGLGGFAQGLWDGGWKGTGDAMKGTWGGMKQMGGGLMQGGKGVLQVGGASAPVLLGGGIGLGAQALAGGLTGLGTPSSVFRGGSGMLGGAPGIAGGPASAGAQSAAQPAAPQPQNVTQAYGNQPMSQVLAGQGQQAQQPQMLPY